MTKKYKELEYGAMRLGSAFQKINFLRDLHADHLHLGRTYFPNLDLNNFDQLSKERIEADIEKRFSGWPGRHSQIAHWCAIRCICSLCVLP